MAGPARERPLDALGVGLLAGLVVVTAVFALTRAPRDVPVQYVGLLAVSFALAGLAYSRLRSALRSLSPARLTRFALITAACLRLAASLAPTSLSDDVYRYVWDGERVRHLVNPYWATPAEMAEAGDATGPFFDEMNSSTFISVYPPLSQAVFAWGVAWADAWELQPDRWLRLLFGLFDLVSVWLLLRLLAAFGRPRELGLLYAWNPLVYWELVGGGHTEAIVLPFLLLAVGRALRGRWLGLGLTLGLAALAKTTALVAAPVLGWFLLTRRRRSPSSRPAESSLAAHGTVARERPWWSRVHERRAPRDTLGWRLAGVFGAAVSCAGVIAAGYAPFWFDGLIDNLRRSLELYYGYFIFNSPLYELSRWLLGYREGVTPDVADQVLPVFTAGLIATIVVAALSVNGRSHRLPAALLAVTLAQVLLSPVFHPWYWMAPLVLGVLAGAWSPLALSALVGVTYLAYDPGVGRVTTAMLWAQFAPFALFLAADIGRALLGPVLRRRARRKYRAVAPWVPPGSRVLDIGAGEGFVGLEAAGDGHEAVLVDVVDHNRTDLPHEVYDGEHLPFDEGEFDVGFLAYVLHHCYRRNRRDRDDGRDGAEAVLRDASRVCGRLVVLESVYESPFDLGLLTRLDHLANWFRGIPIEPLRFDRVEGWLDRFEALGLTVVEWRWLGRFVHKHVLFVLDSPAGSTSGEGGGA